MEEGIYFLDFYPSSTHNFLTEMYGDYLHQNDETHLGNIIADDAICKCNWIKLATQLDV